MIYQLVGFNYNFNIDSISNFSLFNNLVEKALDMTELEVRDKICKIEEQLKMLPDSVEGDDCAPLRHIFLPGLYLREITMPKGLLLTSKIHRTKHPYFVMKGECSVLLGNKVQRIKAPYQGVTMPGTKRLLYIHEETVWTTIHATDKTNRKEIEEDIIAKDFNEFDRLIVDANTNDTDNDRLEVMV